MRRSTIAAVVGAAAAGLAAAAIVSRRSDRPYHRHAAVHKGSFSARNVSLVGLGAQVGATYAGTAARKVFASSERREELDREFEMKSAEQVAERLGNMKGALMKLGQMASYLDEGLPEPMRIALSQLQSSAPPMSPELAAGVIRTELGADPEDLFVEWDPTPIAAASIGQVHRAVWRRPDTGEEIAVAVKVQYPGVDDAIDADLRNVELLGALLKQGFGSLDPTEMVEEIRERIREELDYSKEAANQELFADFYAGHPFIHVPAVVQELSTRRVLTTELVSGVPWKELLTWSQEEKDLAAESIFRFVFRSLYRFRHFNGDPHPGNYLFHGGGKVTFLDFGLVKHFTEEELTTFSAMVQAAALDDDMTEFRRIVEDAGMLRKDAPLDTEEVGVYFSEFYEPVREDRDMTWTHAYASGLVRHVFDRTSPIAQYATVPRSFVFIQRINMGLYAVLGELGARGNYRRIAEELWPFVDGPPSTPMGQVEAAWLADKIRRAGS